MSSPSTVNFEFIRPPHHQSKVFLNHPCPSAQSTSAHASCTASAFPLSRLLLATSELFSANHKLLQPRTFLATTRPHHHPVYFANLGRDTPYLVRLRCVCVASPFPIHFLPAKVIPTGIESCVLSSPPLNIAHRYAVLLSSTPLATSTSALQRVNSFLITFPHGLFYHPSTCPQVCFSGAQSEALSFLPALQTFSPQEFLRTCPMA